MNISTSKKCDLKKFMLDFQKDEATSSLVYSYFAKKIKDKKRLPIKIQKAFSLPRRRTRYSERVKKEQDNARAVGIRYPDCFS